MLFMVASIDIYNISRPTQSDGRFAWWNKQLRAQGPEI